MEEVKYTYNSHRKKRKKYSLVFVLLVLFVAIVTFGIICNTKHSNKKDAWTNTKTTNTLSDSKSPEVADSKTIKKIRRLLDDYCENLFRENFDASDYFADNVEQFISMKNTTASSITRYINGSYHKEFQNGKFYIEKKMFDVAFVEGGGFEAVFIEKGRCYRTSKNKTQYTRVKVKALLNSDLKIYNWKEIEILESRFE
jgi:membrane-associated HD superfamily phosphohydrolase